MNTISTEFSKFNLIYDRAVTDVYQLPYSYEQIEIQPNELAVANTLNIKLRYLYENFLYLYGLCNVANFDIPTTYSGWFGISGNYSLSAEWLEFKLFSNTTPVSTGQTFVSGGDGFKGMANSYLGIGYISPRFGYPILATANKNIITIFGFDKGSYNISVNVREATLTQSIIDPLSGSLPFLNITDIELNKQNDVLYVADGTLNNIYSYDLSDTLLLRTGKMFLLDFVGGKGNITDNSKFDGLNKIAFGDNVLFAEDTNNKCIKCFDKDFNWISTTSLATLFNEVTSFNALNYNERTNQLFACGKRKVYVLDLVDNQPKLTNAYSLSGLIINPDEIVDIKFADYNKDIVYILTKNLLIKKWATKLNETIGVYPSSKLSNTTEFKWIANIANKSLSADNLLVYNTSLNRPSVLSGSNIAFFEDNLDLVSLLRNTDFQIYDFNDIVLNKNEYNQAWIYNKSFKKLFYNLSLLKTNIGYRFYEGRTVEQLLSYVERQYNNAFIDDPDLDTNTFANVCINENFQSSTINRNLRKLYDLEYYLLTSVVNQDNIRTNLLPRTRPGNNAIFDFIIYNQGFGVSVVPDNIKMYSNTDGFISPDNSVNIDNLSPYLSGAGIIII